jgi:hypothetical protein
VYTEVALTHRRGRSVRARRLIHPAPVDVLRRQRESGDKPLPVIFTR